MSNNTTSKNVPFIVISKRAFVMGWWFHGEAGYKWAIAQEAFAEETPWQQLKAESEIAEEKGCRLLSYAITQVLPSVPNNISTHHFPGRDEKVYFVPTAHVRWDSTVIYNPPSI